MITQELLRSADLFAGLSPEDAVALAVLGREEVFRKGQVVFQEKQAADRIYLVVSGVVEITRGAPRVHRLARLERGEVLGEIGTFDGGPRSATATAAVVPETRLVSWDAAGFRRFLQERPRAAAAVLQVLVRKMSARLRHASEAVHVLLQTLP
jgi:CRP-like cAMP-binding protein